MPAKVQLVKLDEKDYYTIKTSMNKLQSNFKCGVVVSDCSSIPTINNLEWALRTVKGDMWQHNFDP